MDYLFFRNFLFFYRKKCTLYFKKWKYYIFYHKVVLVIRLLFVREDSFIDIFIFIVYNYLEFKIINFKIKGDKMPSNLSLKLLVVFSRLSHYMTEKIREDIASYGLNITEFGVLELLYHKGEQPIQQIGKKILLSSGSITYVVDKLENKQLLIRKACPKDRRVTYTVLTEKGKHLMEEIFPKHERFVDDLFSVLSPKEQKTMIALCKKIGLQEERMT